MSRMTNRVRSAPHARASPPLRMSVMNMPRVERRLSLICGHCGTSGKYDVGTVTINPDVAKSVPSSETQDAVGFTGCFRCRKCDAGGPWKLPSDTLVYVTMLMVASVAGEDDLPLLVGWTATFDKQMFRYGTDGEAHLKRLIEDEPDRAFLWVRLGNLYSNAQLYPRAETAYRRAIELDPNDIEAHAMLGQLLVETDRHLEAVPNWHAVLNHAREARQVNNDLRKRLVRGAIEELLEAHARSKGQIELLPKTSPEELTRRSGDEPVVLHLREFDLGSEEGIDQLCGVFLDPPRRAWPSLFPRRKPSKPEPSDRWAATPIQRPALPVGRNDPCPCGSGRKHKKCCGQ